MKEVLLTQGKVALVDDGDFIMVNQFKWHAIKKGHTFYAHRTVWLGNGKQKHISMHRALIGKAGFGVDHIDRNGLNNQRNNLRIATQSQNMANQKKHSDGASQFKGVSWHKAGQTWRATIQIDKKLRHIGCYESETDAAHVYDYVARIYFGEFARTNFPPD